MAISEIIPDSLSRRGFKVVERDEDSFRYRVYSAKTKSNKGHFISENDKNVIYLTDQENNVIDFRDNNFSPRHSDPRMLNYYLQKCDDKGKPVYDFFSSGEISSKNFFVPKVGWNHTEFMDSRGLYYSVEDTETLSNSLSVALAETILDAQIQYINGKKDIDKSIKSKIDYWNRRKSDIENECKREFSTRLQEGRTLRGSSNIEDELELLHERMRFRELREINEELQFQKSQYETAHSRIGKKIPSPLDIISFS